MMTSCVAQKDLALIFAANEAIPNGFAALHARKQTKKGVCHLNLLLVYQLRKKAKRNEPSLKGPRNHGGRIKRKHYCCELDTKESK